MGKTLNKNRFIIIGGRIESIDDNFARCITDKDFVVCTDRGYIYAHNKGIVPDLIIGDFDSAPEPDAFECEILKLPTHKDDTDLHYAARLGIKKGYSNFLLCGVTGGRLDQTVASVSTLNFLVSVGAKAEISDENSKVYITDSIITFPRPLFPCYFSVFPLEGRAEGVSISGGVYTLDKAVLTNDFPIGVSNEFSEDKATVSVEKGKVLIIIVKK